MNPRIVDKPPQRSYLRQIAGREYFTLGRRFDWFIRQSFARSVASAPLKHRVFRHRTMMLRPLRDVEMYLQHNKITNLRLAIAPINGIVIRPGETFSLWRLVGRPKASRGFLEGLVFPMVVSRKASVAGCVSSVI